MGISNCNYDVRGSIRSAYVYWKVRSLYQPGKIGNAFTEANSKQQYPTVPNSTPQDWRKSSSCCVATLSPAWQHTGPSSTQALALELYTFPAWQHTGPGTGVVYFPRLAAHRPWHWSCIISPPGSTQALALELYNFPRLAANRPWLWSCILSPAWQHTGPGTGVVYFPPPGSIQALALELYTFPRLAAHRPWHWSCILPPPGSTQALALEL